MHITTADGSVVVGTVSGGVLNLKTVLGDLKIEGQRIQTLSGAAITLDDGSVLKGTIGGGELQVTTAHGQLAIPGQNITGMQALQGVEATPSMEASPRSVGERQVPPVPEYFGLYVVSQGKVLGTQEEKLVYVGDRAGGVIGVKDFTQTQAMDPTAYFLLFDPKAADIARQIGLWNLRYLDRFHRPPSPLDILAKTQREELLLAKLEHFIKERVRVTEAELQEAFLLEKEQVSVEYLAVDPAQLVKQVQVSGQEAMAYYQNNQERFRRPDQVRVAYLVIDPNAFIFQEQVTHEQLRNYYEAHREEFRQEPQARAEAEAILSEISINQNWQPGL